MPTRFKTLCPHIDIWRARQEMLNSYQRYRELSDLTTQAEKEWKKNKRIFEELEIQRFMKEEFKPKVVKEKEIKLTIEQVRSIAAKMGVSIDF